MPNTFVSVFNQKYIDMKMVKIFLTVSILLVSTLIFAQPPGGGQRRRMQDPSQIPNDKQIEKIVNKIADKLALSNEQETKVLSIYKEHFAKVKEKTSGKKSPGRREMKTLKITFEKSVKA